MVATEPASAIVVRVPPPCALERSRRRWDRAAGVGVTREPLEVRFRPVGRVPGVVDLAPEPSAPSRA